MYYLRVTYSDLLSQNVTICCKYFDLGDKVGHSWWEWQTCPETQLVGICKYRFTMFSPQSVHTIAMRMISKRPVSSLSTGSSICTILLWLEAFRVTIRVGTLRVDPLTFAINLYINIMNNWIWLWLVHLSFDDVVLCIFKLCNLWQEWWLWIPVYLIPKGSRFV